VAVICKNCGFSNADGDEFCGNCGKYLEFSGVVAEEPQATPTSDGSASAGGQGALPPPPPLDEGTTAMPVPPPPPPDSGVAAPPPPPLGGGTDQAQPSGRGPDVICWNCSRRNPAGRTFCIQCGERLAAGKPTSAVAGGAVAAAGGAGAGAAGGAGGPPPPPGGGPPYKVIGIGAGILIALLIVAVVVASFLGNSGPTATPTHIGGFSPSPSTGTSPTAATSSPLPSAASPIPTASAITPTATPTTPTETASPTPEVTPKPTARPTRTPGDPNAKCANVGNRNKQHLTMSAKGGGVATWKVSGRAWCIKEVIFTRGSGSGTLKLYLVNSKFNPSPYGWAEVQQPQGFNGSSTYVWDNSIDLPQGYDNIPTGTTIQFKTGGASGSVEIVYVEARG
jgi:hypothetical protein